MRTYEESCAHLDKIVGRCVFDAEFAASVLADPEAALKAYNLTEDELDDFRVLKRRHLAEASSGWTAIRIGLEQMRKQQRS
jgi:hypothetical protein